MFLNMKIKVFEAFLCLLFSIKSLIFSEFETQSTVLLDSIGKKNPNTMQKRLF